MRIRQTVRLLVIDRHQRILLFQIDDAMALHVNRPDMLVYWVTPGGGLEQQETFEQAAHRELWEETGLRVEILGPCIWHHERILTFSRGRMLMQERYYLAPVSTSEVSLVNLLPHEQRTHRAYRWWNVEELAQSHEFFVPAELPQVVQPILMGHIPAEPVHLPS